MKKNTNILYKVIGANIKAKRLAQGKTQTDLSKELDVGRTSIANIESGSQKLPLDLLYDICDLLHCNIYEILPSADLIRKERNLVVHGSSSEETLSDLLSI